MNLPSSMLTEIQSSDRDVEWEIKIPFPTMM